MGDNTAIQWSDSSWNPIVGCSRVSEGCRHCYAERQAFRAAAMGISRYDGLTKKVGGEIRWTGELRLVESALDLPLKWKKPRRIFVNSMSDLFHEQVPDEWIDRIFAVMALASNHSFQVLTKRPDRMRTYLAGAEERVGRAGERLASRLLGEEDEDDSAWRDQFWKWPLPNVWLGVSIEDQATADARIPLLLQTPAAVRWVSYEPALGPVDFAPWVAPCDGVTWLCERCGFRLGRATLHAATGLLTKAESPGRDVCPNDGVTLVPDRRLDWLVVGGESGPGARPFDVDWARETIAQGRAAGVPVFCKQIGSNATGYPMKPGYRYLTRDRKGGAMEEWPEDLRVREFPA